MIVSAKLIVSIYIVHIRPQEGILLYIIWTYLYALQNITYHVVLMNPYC